MIMYLHKFCYGCDQYRDMNSIKGVDERLLYFECSVCGKRNEVGER